MLKTEAQRASKPMGSQPGSVPMAPTMQPCGGVSVPRTEASNSRHSGGGRATPTSLQARPPVTSRIWGGGSLESPGSQGGGYRMLCDPETGAELSAVQCWFLEARDAEKPRCHLLKRNGSLCAVSCRGVMGVRGLEILQTPNRPGHRAPVMKPDP